MFIFHFFGELQGVSSCILNLSPLTKSFSCTVEMSEHFKYFELIFNSIHVNKQQAPFTRGFISWIIQLQWENLVRARNC